MDKDQADKEIEETEGDSRKSPRETSEQEELEIDGQELQGAKFEARARLLRLQFKELLEFMGLCLTDKAWDTYNRRLMHNPQEPPEKIYYGIVTELTKQYSESPKHAFSTLCKMRYKKDIFRHSTEIYRLTKLAFPNMAADARDQVCVHVFWKSLPQSKLVEGYFNTFTKMEKQTLSEAVTLVGDSLDSSDDEHEKTEDENDDKKETVVTATAYWPYSNRGKGKGKGKGKGWYYTYNYGKGYGPRKGYGYSKGKAKGGKGKGKYKRPASQEDGDDDEQNKRMKVITPQQWFDDCCIGHPSKFVEVGDSQERVVGHYSLLAVTFYATASGSTRYR